MDLPPRRRGDESDELNEVSHPRSPGEPSEDAVSSPRSERGPLGLPRDASDLAVGDVPSRTGGGWLRIPRV